MNGFSDGSDDLMRAAEMRVRTCNRSTAGGLATAWAGPWRQLLTLRSFAPPTPDPQLF